MNIFKRHINIRKDTLFKDNGDFNLTEDLANLLDTILIVMIIKEKTSLVELNLELRRCGFFTTQPELKEITNKLAKDGMIRYDAINAN